MSGKTRNQTASEVPESQLTVTKTDLISIVQGVLDAQKPTEDPLVVAVKQRLGVSTLPIPSFNNRQTLTTPELLPLLLSGLDYKDKDISGKFGGSGPVVRDYADALSEHFSVPTGDANIRVLSRGFKILASLLLPTKATDSKVTADAYFEQIDPTLDQMKASISVLLEKQYPGYLSLEKVGKENFPVGREWIANKLAKVEKDQLQVEDAEADIGLKRKRPPVCPKCGKKVVGMTPKEHRSLPKGAPGSCVK
jgi:hypothetical protein